MTCISRHDASDIAGLGDGHDAKDELVAGHALPGCRPLLEEVAAGVRYSVLRPRR